MKWPHLHQARTRRSRTAARAWRWALAAVAALLLASLAIVTGLLTHQLLVRDVPAGATLLPPASLPLGAWFEPLADWSPLALTITIGALALGAALLWVWIGRAAQGEAQRAVDALREALRDRAYARGACDLLGQPRSHPEELLLGDCARVQHGLASLWQMAPRAIVGGVVLLATAALTDPWVTLLGLLLGGAATWCYGRFAESCEARTHQLHGDSLASERLLVESLRLAPLTAIFQLPSPPGEPFERSLASYSAQALRERLVRSSLGPLRMALIAVVATILLLVFALNPQLRLAEGAVLGTSLGMTCVLIAQGMRLLPNLDVADEAAARILGYLEPTAPLAEVKSPRSVARLAQGLRLDGVSLEDRQGRKVLNNATCEIPANRRVALIASDPVAPAALAGLCARLYDPVEGRVQYDGVDLRGVNLTQLRAQTAVVTGDELLFTASVADNISCGQPYTRAEVEDVARRTGADALIHELADSYDTVVGPLGSDVRPELAFRIGLSRALLRDPSLLIIEEPRHLDGGEDNGLEQILETVSLGRTLVVLPRRPETLRRADLVIVLHEGALEGMGTHSHLLQTSDLYRHLVYIRFNPYAMPG